MQEKRLPVGSAKQEVWPTYPALLTIAQVAALLQVHERTIPLLIRNEGLPACLVGPCIRRVDKFRPWNWLQDKERWKP